MSMQCVSTTASLDIYGCAVSAPFLSLQLGLVEGSVSADRARRVQTKDPAMPRPACVP